MKSHAHSPALVLLGLAGLTLVAASDPRTIHCTQTTTVTLQAAEGTIDIKNPLASGTLKTLYRQDDHYDLEGGKDYSFFFNESRNGLFRFELRFSPRTPGPAWSCRVQTIPEAPFISVDHQAWSASEAAGQVTINTDRGKTFITILGPKPGEKAPTRDQPMASRSGSRQPGATS
jgi:hypothetical protein